MGATTCVECVEQLNEQFDGRGVTHVTQHIRLRHPNYELRHDRLDSNLDKSKGTESLRFDAQEAAARVKKKCMYAQINTIPPTSNLAERPFSVARITYGLHRHALLPVSREMVLFLKTNNSYRDAQTLHERTD
ncbi:Hypothetical protein PHPALM_9110 [Phytophthora palmivora]|uniref:HAT C-terminal dimerisation domain-containing protein n=1 Tax=Phytophthora palmivora TaxID=4796 RepID=A0A2P4Y840_9STRA|nr:Hypothetical protein PHPALM_9110 [Phytophthora palmivora]